MKPHQIWASVAIVFILVASTTTLVILNRDVSVILTLVALIALPLLGALGGAVYQKMDQKMDQIKENTNDNMHRVLNMHEKSTEQLTSLALSMTPPAATSEGEEQPVVEEVR